MAGPGKDARATDRAWSEAGPVEVAPDVHRIPLPLPSDALRAVNAYLIDDPDGPVVVDPGWAGPETDGALRAALADAGHALGDVRQFLITHAHWDHYTQAVVTRRATGARVRLGRGEKPTLDAFGDGDPRSYPQQVRLLALSGAEELAQEVAAMTMTEDDRGLALEGPDDWLDDRQRIELAGRTLEVVATPGHTRGHVVLRDAAAGLLFAGDHVLPHITPSIGFERAPEPLPLRSYLDSLELVRGHPDLLLLPAHGPVTRSAHARVGELLAHHEERLAAVLGLVRAGRSTAHAVAAAMPWTRRRHVLAELAPTHRMLAILEIQAHLDVLVLAGELTEAVAEPVRHYSA